MEDNKKPDIYKLIENMKQFSEHILHKLKVEIEELKTLQEEAYDEIPNCIYCGKHMIDYIPEKGKFKGTIQQYSWICDCSKFQKHNQILGVG